MQELLWTRRKYSNNIEEIFECFNFRIKGESIMAWTDQMIEDLKRMWKEGLTTGEIGKRLGVTKNSIVGKVHRLGLSGRPSPIKKKTDSSPSSSAAKPTAAPKISPKSDSAPKSKFQHEAPAEKNISQTAAVATKSEAPKEEKNISDTETAPAFINKHQEIRYDFRSEVSHPLSKGGYTSLISLDNHTCRWPIGDPKDEGFHFCGKKVRLGQTYCEEHAAIAYVKPTSKK